jgi:DNA-binding transcriptional MerR regulator
MKKRTLVHRYSVSNPSLLLLSDVARLVPCKPYQIVYLLTSGQVPEPALRLGGRRLFTEEDVDRIRNLLLL